MNQKIIFIIGVLIFSVCSSSATVDIKKTKLRQISVVDGRFTYPNGIEVSLWGVNYNVSLGYCFNKFADAGLLTAGEFDEKKYFEMVDEGLDELERMECEVIRVHLSPHELTNFDGSLKDTPNLRVLDYVMAQCRKRGIYYYFAFLNDLGANTSNVAGTLMQADDGTVINRDEWFTNVNFIKRTQNYMQCLLTHENRYDKILMLDDPAFCIAELVNEPTTPQIDNPKAPYHEVYARWLSQRKLENTKYNYQLWREEITLNYQNGMYDFLTNMGCKAPVGWSHKWVGAIRHSGGDAEWKACLRSKIPAVCFSTYPTQDTTFQYLQDATKDLRKMGSEHNALPYLQAAYNDYQMQGWAHDPSFRRKGHFVYEWEIHANMTSYMYPEMAKYFRSQGVQIATMWEYIPPKLTNYAAGQHLLNLKSTPGKSASFIIAGKVFHNTPLYKIFSMSDNDADYFKDTAVDFKFLISAYADNESLVYSGSLPSRYANNLLTFDKMAGGFKRIFGIGDSPLVKYSGTGLYFIDVNDINKITIEIMPDCKWIRSAVTGGKLLDQNGQAPADDDRPHKNPVDYWETIGKYSKLPSNIYTSDVEHAMEITLPNMPPAPTIYRIQGDTKLLVNPLCTEPLKFMVKPGKYFIISGAKGRP